MSDKHFILCIFSCILLAACGGEKDKKKAMTGNNEITVNDFIDFYPDLSLPFRYADSSFPKKEADSLLISPQVFYRFAPDSLLKDVADTTQQAFYPIGKFSNGGSETYLLSRAVGPHFKVMLVTAYDKDMKYISGMPLIRIGKTPATDVSVTIDPRFNFSKKIVRLMPDESMVQGYDVYILNTAARNFLLIMTDSLGQASGPLINPIDTLPRKHKFAADYGDGKRNLISFRDAGRDGRLLLFINIENKKEGCEGELKGEVSFTAPNKAEYRQAGDACVLSFVFTDKNVTIKEMEGCGSRLGNLQCSFNGIYAKHSATKKSGKR